MTASVIQSVVAYGVWDSRGRPTVEVEIRLAGGAVGRAIAPSGASRGSGEAVDLRDGGPDFGGYGVTRAVTGVGHVVAPALAGIDAADQAAVDRLLTVLDGTADKSRLGGNATIAVSLAAAHAAAANAGVPLWRWLGDGPPSLPLPLPLPEIQIFGGGAHAARRLDIQDFMVVAVGASSYFQALDWTAEVYRHAGEALAKEGLRFGVADEGGWWPAFDRNEDALARIVRAIEAAGLVAGADMAISVDVAASEFGRDGRYHLARDGKELDADGMIELVLGWLERYPIVSVEDPLAEDDLAGWAALRQAAPARVQIVGDDLLVSSASRIEAAARAKLCDAALIKPNQAGTLTETRAALEAARAAGWGAIASARSGETEDVSIVHLAVGWGMHQLKVGSFARSERMAKWNEGIRIARLGGDMGPLPPRETFPWGRA